MHEPESLPSGSFIDFPPADDRDGLETIQGFTNDLGSRYATLSGAPLQHALVTRLDIDLFPNHRSPASHTSQHTSQIPRVTSADRDIRAAAARYGVRFIDGNELMGEAFINDRNNFVDGGHRNPFGATMFSRALADVLRALPPLGPRAASPHGTDKSVCATLPVGTC